jgi:arginyl-tRNA synthetase
MGLYDQLHTFLLASAAQWQQDLGLPPLRNGDKVVIEHPKDPSHGDLSTNIAMVLSKDFQKSPRDVAAYFITQLETLPFVSAASIAGPGFINMTIHPSHWVAHVPLILGQGKAYGHVAVGKGQTVNIEFVSANPTGPLHIGHCRIAIVGDILAALLEQAGYTVVREFYVNDAGAQTNELARSLYQRYLEALGLPNSGPAAYGGAYLIPVAQALAQAEGHRYVGLDESVWREPLKTVAVAAMMDLIKEGLQALHIKHDLFSSEKAMIEAGTVQETIDTLQQKGLVYEGVLTPPKGQVIDDWEPRPQLLFAATQFGDDVDRPLKKSDGTWTYFASDIAYHKQKADAGAHHLINIWGADHGGYVKRIQASLKALKGETPPITCLLCQMVRFIKQGQVLKMSKREGNFITVQDAIQTVGLDAIRFMMVFRKNDAALDFDFEKVVEQTKDNPVFYVHYAYARCHSIVRQFETTFPGEQLTPERLQSVNLELLEDPAFVSLTKKLVFWPKLVELSAKALEPHRIPYYLLEVAATFHALWTQGREQLSLRFIDPQSLERTLAHLALVESVRCVLESGLRLLGLTPRETM